MTFVYHCAIYAWVFICSYNHHSFHYHLTKKMRLTYSFCKLHCKESTSQNFSKTYPIFFAADVDGFLQCESEAWILCGLPATGKLDN